jgi:succinyl-CoA synthetase beta subunit
MKLKEFEGKEILKEVGFKLPKSQLIKKTDYLVLNYSSDLLLKAQIFSNSRGKNGGILFPKSESELNSSITKLFSNNILGEEVNEILIEDKINFKEEFYLGIIFDSKSRSPMIILSKFGGVNIETIPQEFVIKEPTNILEPLENFKAREIVIKAGFEGKLIIKVTKEIVNLYNCFKKYDMKMVEINPLFLDQQDNLIAGDCVMVLDDDSFKRQNFSFQARTDTKKKTNLELEANKIDENDHRGVCGKTFIELDGNIGVLSSGGGASVTAMDALILSGGNPANFTEYSGNPPAEKVRKLTQVLLKKKGLDGLFIVGGRANFTRIDVTLKAIIDVIIESKFRRPIVIRRAGPGYEEAFNYIKEMSSKHNLEIYLSDDTIPISQAAQKIVEVIKGSNI